MSFQIKKEDRVWDYLIRKSVTSAERKLGYWEIENNGTWSLPGGWCDVDQSVASNTVKEVKEETGFTVTAEKLIAVQDWRKHNVTNYAYGVVKIFVQCKYESGEFEDNIETTGIAFFDEDTLPENLAVEKCTREQILMCFEALRNPNAPTAFD